MSDITRRLERADKFIQKGKPELAAQEYLQALAEEPTNHRVRQVAADLLLSSERAREAVPLLRELFAYYEGCGDNAKAVITYKKLARAGAASPQETFKFAQLEERHSKREAIDAYNSVIVSCGDSGDGETTLAALRRVVVLEASCENFMRLAAQSEKSGLYAEAAAALVHAAQLSSNPSSAYEKAFTLDPANSDAALGHARCLLAAGEPEAACEVLAPVAKTKDAPRDLVETYVRGLLDASQLVAAEPLLWQLFEEEPRFIHQVARLIGGFLEAGDDERAITAARRVEQHQRKAGLRREYVNLVKGIADEHRVSVPFLEYLAELFDTSNRELDYCNTLQQLFDLYYSAGKYEKAADSLDRACEVDAYEPGHQKRLEMLRGKIEVARINLIAARLAAVLGTATASAKVDNTPDTEPSTLDDLIVQAEIFLRYGMRERAIHRIERIRHLFPKEEEESERLRDLMLEAGLQPSTATNLRSAAPARPTANGLHGPPARAIQASYGGLDDIAVVTQMTRKIASKQNVKAVLGAAVNEIGRYFEASRCVAALCTPGKPPSAAIEYCTPGVAKSDVMSMVQLITAMQTLSVSEGGLVVVEETHNAPEVGAIGEVIEKLKIGSLLVVPLLDGDQQSGILILQSQSRREWEKNETMLLRTIADQTILAVNNARLRSLVRDLGVTEEKSGLLRRTSYLDVLMSEVRRATQQQSTVTVLLLNFGKASPMMKHYGEPAVQTFMQQVGQTICAHLRQTDVAVRYDLTDIALVLSETGEKNAIFVVDKLRRALDGITLPGSKIPVQFTAGVAEAVVHAGYEPADIVTELINRVEAAQQVAIMSGPNSTEALASRFAMAATA